MSWYQQNRKHKKRRVLITVTLLILLLAVIDMFSGFRVRSIVQQAFGETLVATESTLGGLRDTMLTEKQTLAAENEALRGKVRELEDLILRHSVVRAENRALRDLIAVVDDQAEGIATRVISYERSSPYGTILIAAGAADGIVVGDIVVGGSAVALGTTLDVHEHTSLVQLFTQEGQMISVRIGDVLHEMAGVGSGNAEITLPRDVPIAEGDDVFLAENGFLVGVVGHVDVRPADALQTVLVSSPINIVETPFVTVIPAR